MAAFVVLWSRERVPLSDVDPATSRSSRRFRRETQARIEKLFKDVVSPIGTRW
jgi:hypothetical protein